MSRADEELARDPEGFARRIALARLDARAYTRAELGAYLARKNVPEDVAVPLLDRFEEVGLLDDATYAANYAASRHEYAHHGRWVIKRDLARRGVAEEDIRNAVEDIDDEAEFAAAMAFATKKLRSMSALEPLVVRRRLAGGLARRGFGPGTVSAVLAELRAGAAEADLE